MKSIAAIILGAFLAGSITASPYDHILRRKCVFLDSKTSFSIPSPPPRSVFVKESVDLKGLIGKRSSQDNILLNRESNSAVEDILSAVGASYKDKPITYTLASLASHDALIHVLRAQESFRIPTPSQGFGIIPSVDDGSIYSYPSAFACNVQVAVYVLELCVGRSVEIADKTRDRMLTRRINGGLEFPCAITAGHNLAHAIVRAMASNPVFKEKLKDARAEWIKR